MAYTINKTDGSVVATITDGTIDNSTSLTLFGKSYSGFGELLNENLLKLLENSASTAQPTTPLKGELWFDTTSNHLRVYDGTAFKPSGGSRAQSASPTSPSAGDLWLDTDDNQLYVYTGSAWQLVGPVYSSGQTLSGWLIETLGSAGGNKVVSSMYAGNTRVAILSGDEFTPTISQTGFATIYKGITLNSALGGVFSGTTTAAQFLNDQATTNSGNDIAGGNFLRSDAADTTTGAITIDTDTGLIVGDAQEFSVTVSSNNVILAQTSQDKDIKFTINDGGATPHADGSLKITGATGDITLTGNTTIAGNLTITGSYDKASVDVSTYVDAYIGLNEGNASDVDGGLIIEKASGEARIFWDTSETFWSAGITGSYSQVIRLADAVADGNAAKEKVLKTSAAGLVTVTNVSLAAVGTISEGDTTNKNVPTIGAVVTFGDKWGGAAYTVSTSAPGGGDGSDGDFWFVREA